MAIENHYTAFPDGPLFHYTSQQGLLGILTSKAIWATDILYLNDAAELRYAIQLTAEQIGGIRKTLGREEQVHLDTVEEMLAQLKPSRYWSIFVASFSSVGDELSQWRGYCPEAGGYSLGFDFTKLERAMSRQSFRLARCVYDPRVQIDMIKGFLQQAIQISRDRKRGAARLALTDNDPYGEIERCFLEIAPIMKHLKYSEEDEWRLISRPLPFDHVRVHFREGRSMVIPYCEFLLAEDNEALGIAQVIIGPTPHPHLSRSSVAALVHANGIRGCAIRVSDIPFRAW